MDGVRGVDERSDLAADDYSDGAVAEHPIEVGGDERRMHVRAYNYWVSLLQGRAYPSIDNLHPENITDFGANSVLLDFSAGLEDPAIKYLGAALRTECGVDAHITHVSQVPSRSLLSRLTDHYLQIIANRAPIGFEAEFVSQRGHNTMYRGILMPFSSGGDSIDYIYGVINWKELVDADTQARLHAEIEAARRTAPRPTLAAPIWADGPSGGMDATPARTLSAASAPMTVPTPAPSDELLLNEETALPAESLLPTDSLGDRLVRARESAAAARASDVRSRAALYRALARAYDFALAAEADAEGYALLLARAGIAVQERAPMTPVVKLVFGVDYDKTRVTEFAAVLSHARRCDTGSGSLEALLEGSEGGIKGLVQAERAHRAGEATPKPAVSRAYARAAAKLQKRSAIAQVAIAADGEDFVILLARPNAEGMLEIVAQLGDAPKLTEQVMRKAVG